MSVPCYFFIVNGFQFIAPCVVDIKFAGEMSEIDVYGRTAEFTENSATVVTDSGEYEMEAPCLRLSQGQLYAPMHGFCKHIRMTPYYYEYNNFIDILSNTEHVPIPVQP